MTPTLPALHGLILAGGRSSRMGTDKALLRLKGRTLIHRAADLLRSHVNCVFVSDRMEQDHGDLPRIVDRFSDGGPAAGILSAMMEYPDAAWLVLACDMAYVDSATIDALIRARAGDATALAHTDGSPEPLCAIYEPSIRTALEHGLARGPRAVLRECGARLVMPGNPAALRNVNTPEEFQEAEQWLSRGADS